VQAQRPGVLRLGLSGDVSSMDPHWLNTASNAVVSRHVFELLVDASPQGRLVPGLAESWKLVEPMTWEFRLRRGVKFHDGSDFTAEDVEFSLNRPKQLTGTPSGFASFVRGIESMQVVDKHTIRMRMTSPNNAWFPGEMSNPYIISKKAALSATAQADFDNGRAMVGTGPFKFVRFTRGDRVELARHENWWANKERGTPVFEHVTLRILVQSAARMAALLSGDVDAIENVPAQDLAQLLANPKFHISRQVSWRTMMFHMDQARDVSPFITDKAGQPLKRNPFKDLRVRLAFSKAINRQALAERVMEGLAVPAANLLSPGVFGHNSALKPDAYDPEGAKRLLAEAGWPDGFGLTLHATNNRYLNDEQVVQAVAGMLSRIGIQTKVVTLPQASFFPRANKAEFSFCMVGWGSLNGDSSMRMQFGTYNELDAWGSWNQGRSSTPELDALLRKARGTIGENEREALTRDAATIIQKQQLALLLYHQVVTWALRRGIDYPGRVDEYMLAQGFVTA
jgi:peptide/nickel transport system substrate-binding protein